MGKEIRRVRLERGKQRELIFMLVDKFGSVRKISTKFGIPYSTMKNYFEEIRLLPESLFNKILTLAKIKKSDLDIDYLNANWGRILGARRGMAALERKYPEKIYEWRVRGLEKAKLMGKHHAYASLKSIKYPKLDKKLAEFIGVYLGDGTLSEYQIRISGDYRYDYYYNIYLQKLIKDLFGIEATIRKEKYANTSTIVVYSKNLCSFLNENFDMKFGDKIKNRNIIPKKILEDKELFIACLRGLIDTDGSVSRRGRGGSQFCVQFTSHNKLLLHQVDDIGKKLNIFTFLDNTGTGTNKWDNIIRYFKIVGSSNLKHIIRFYLRFYENRTIYQKDLIEYYQKDLYRKLSLPFRL